MPRRHPSANLPPDLFPGEVLPAYWQVTDQNGLRVRKREDHASLAEALEHVGMINASLEPNILAVYPDRSKLAFLRRRASFIGPTGRYFPLHSSRSGPSWYPGQAKDAFFGNQRPVIEGLLEEAIDLGYIPARRFPSPKILRSDAHAELHPQLVPLLKSALDRLDPHALLAVADLISERTSDPLYTDHADELRKRTTELLERLGGGPSRYAREYERLLGNGT